MQINHLSADNLIKELRARHLETTGTRSVLLTRLRKHLQESALKRNTSKTIQATSAPVSVAILGSAVKDNTAEPIGAASFVEATTISAQFKAAHQIALATTTVSAMPLSAQDVAAKARINNGDGTVTHENNLPGGIIALSSMGTDPSTPASASKDGVQSALDLPGTPTATSATTTPGKAIAGVEGEESLQEAIARRRERFGLPPLPKPAGSPRTEDAGDDDDLLKLEDLGHARFGKPSKSHVNSPTKATTVDAETTKSIRPRHERFSTEPKPAVDRPVKTTAEEEEEAELIRRRHERFGTGPKKPKSATVEGSALEAKKGHELKRNVKAENGAAPTADNVASNAGQDASGAGQKKRKRDDFDDDVCCSPASKRRVDGRVKHEVEAKRDRREIGQEDRRTGGHIERNVERRKVGHMGVGGCRDGRIAKTGHRRTGCVEISGHAAKPIAQGLRECEKEPPAVSQRAVQHDVRKVEQDHVEGDAGGKWCEQLRGKAKAVKRGGHGRGRARRCLEGRIVKPGRRGTGAVERSGRSAPKTEEPIAQGLRGNVKETRPAVSKGAAHGNGEKVEEVGASVQGNMGRQQWKRGVKSMTTQRNEDGCLRARGCRDGRIVKARRPGNNHLGMGGKKNNWKHPPKK